eukprot:CAMPEP_0201106356 /NCGR_PEP_ID=MMETSP0812-20130820/50963_1 /ASSEMBLY_ACC=CAM_ASM_000668 /TAXON_ID=98059 /ORGANISM="Dinobryon sp., Strain UTEXLB2267" /LENGTH=170 /DNA_ID=CAMNT_0047366657 /DNA_START=258 /DNA_END=770 /DNA_ORIENTATION=+
MAGCLRCCFRVHPSQLHVVIVAAFTTAAIFILLFIAGADLAAFFIVIAYMNLILIFILIAEPAELLCRRRALRGGRVLRGVGGIAAGVFTVPALAPCLHSQLSGASDVGLQTSDVLVHRSQEPFHAADVVVNGGVDGGVAAAGATVGFFRWSLCRRTHGWLVITEQEKLR